MGLVFFDDKDHFIAPGGKRFDRERLEIFLREKGIALSDTAHSVVRLKANASDNFLQVVEPVDLSGLLARIPDCRTVVTTGQKATETLLTLIDAPQPVVGGSVEFVYDGRRMNFWRMPSSSRAYPKPLSEKAAIYRFIALMHSRLFRAPGDLQIIIFTTDFWTDNGGVGNPANPPTGSLPLVDTPELTKFSQTLTTSGLRSESGSPSGLSAEGSFWSGTPYNVTHGYRFYFHTGVIGLIQVGHLCQAIIRERARRTARAES